MMRLFFFPQFICKWLTTNPTNSIYPRLQTQKNSIELFVSSTVNRHICYEQWENEVKPKNNEGNKVTVKVQKWYKRWTCSADVMDDLMI